MKTSKVIDVRRYGDIIIRRREDLKTGERYYTKEVRCNNAEMGRVMVNIKIEKENELSREI